MGEDNFDNHGAGTALRVLTFLLCVALTGCTEFSSAGCPAGLAHAKTAELFFGRNAGTTEAVGNAEWQSFVDAEIAPRFPDGFTLSDASGAWRGRGGRAVRERTKRLFVVLKGTSDEPEKLAAIRKAYLARFHQDSVMLFEGEGCVSF